MEKGLIIEKLSEVSSGNFLKENTIFIINPGILQ